MVLFGSMANFSVRLAVDIGRGQEIDRLDQALAKNIGRHRFEVLVGIKDAARNESGWKMK